MEEEKPIDLRVPLISGLFFVSCLTGGILLVLWLFDVQGSQSWFPILALVLISFPWIFWILAYIYTFIKLYFQRRGGGGGGGGDGSVSHSVSKRSNHAKAAATNTNGTSSQDSPVNSPNSQRQVRFGAAVVMGGGDDGRGRDEHHHNGGGELPVAPLQGI